MKVRNKKHRYREKYKTYREDYKNVQREVNKTFKQSYYISWLSIKYTYYGPTLMEGLYYKESLRYNRRIRKKPRIRHGLVNDFYVVTCSVFLWGRSSTLSIICLLTLR